MKSNKTLKFELSPQKSKTSKLIIEENVDELDSDMRFDTDRQLLITESASDRTNVEARSPVDLKPKNALK